MREHRRAHRQPLDRAQHRNRRSQHAVRINQRRSRQAEHQDLFRVLATETLERAADQSRECQHPALALVVEPQDDQQIFHRHHHHQRPDNQGCRAHQILRTDRRSVLPGETFAERIQRARSDIAKNNAQGSESGDREVRFVARVASEGVVHRREADRSHGLQTISPRA